MRNYPFFSDLSSLLALSTLMMIINDSVISLQDVAQDGDGGIGIFSGWISGRVLVDGKESFQKWEKFRRFFCKVGINFDFNLNVKCYSLS